MVLSMTRMWNLCWSSTYTHDILSKYNFQAGHSVSFDWMNPCRSHDTRIFLTEVRIMTFFRVVLVFKNSGGVKHVAVLSTKSHLDELWGSKV